MKVLWISSWFPTKFAPFNGDFVERMGIAVSRYVKIVLLHVAECPVESIEIHKEIDSFEKILIFVPCTAKWNYPLRIFRIWQGFRLGIKETGNLSRFSLVHIHIMYPIGILCCFYCAVRRIRWVITDHWSDFRRVNWHKLWWLPRIICKIVAKRAEIILPVIDQMGYDMKEIGIGARFKSIPNVVDCSLFVPKPKDQDGLFRFIHVSNMGDEVKNVSSIISIFKQVSRKINNISLEIVGNSHDLPLYQQLVKELDLNSKVTFFGEATHSMVAQRMVNSDCLVHFSNFENLPCVILEAMACGKPIIASQTGGIEQWVNDKVGFLVEPKNEEELYIAMRDMVSVHMKFDGDYIRKIILKNCTPEIIGKDILSVYLAIINGEKIEGEY